jgi:hypothetical protein
LLTPQSESLKVEPVKKYCRKSMVTPLKNGALWSNFDTLFHPISSWSDIFEIGQRALQLGTDPLLLMYDTCGCD